MKQIRIRSVFKDGKTSGWIYLHEITQHQKDDKENLFTIQSQAEETKRLIPNQYGRFKYSEKQYGKIPISKLGIEVLNNRIRIKTNNSNYIYNHGVISEGEFSKVRIRPISKNGKGDWVYSEKRDLDWTI